MAAPISDLYERYKIGTKHVVQWLAETAGKTVSSEDKVVTISTDEIVELADSISRANATAPDSAAPKDIDSTIRILEDVICGRKECAAWYRHQTADNDKDQSFERKQRSHQHFIDVLRTVLTSLKGILNIRLDNFAKRKGKGKAAEFPASPGHDACDIYEVSGIEDSSDDSLASAAVNLNLQQHSSTAQTYASGRKSVSKNGSKKQRNKKKKKEKKKQKGFKVPVFELEPQAEDEDFALWCLLKDCYQIRLFVRASWQGYLEGKVSYHIAAAISDKAFLLVQGLVSIFTTDYANLSTMEQVADHLRVDMSVKGRSIESFSCKGSTNTSLEVEAVELVCAPAFLHIMMSRQTLEAAERKPGSTQWENDWDRKIMHQIDAHPLNGKVLMFARDLSRGWQDYVGFITQTGSDVFTVDLTATFFAKTVPLHTVIEFQTYMDIAEMNDTLAQVNYCSLLEAKDTMLRRIRKFEHDVDTLRFKLPRQLSTDTLVPVRADSELRKHCRYIMSEAMESYANVRENPVSRNGPTDPKVYCPWVVNLPVFGGTLLGELLSAMYIDGISACDQNCVVLSVAHVYRACRSSGLMTQPWKDMDDFISTIAPDSLKLPSPEWSSSALRTSAQHYEVALGIVSGRLNSQTNRASLPSAKEVEQRRTHLLPCSGSLKSRYAPLSTFTLPPSPDKATAPKGLSQGAKTAAGDVSEAMTGRWKTDGAVTPIDILTKFKAQAESEELIIMFDHHNFMLDCWMLLFHAGHTPDLPIYGELSKTCTFAELTHAILWEAADVGIASIRGGARTALGFIASELEARYIQEAKTKNCSLAQKFRDGALRSVPTARAEFGDPMPDDQDTTEETPSEASYISVAGRKVDFRAGELSVEEEARLRLLNGRK